MSGGRLLAIETSCDETAAAVVRRHADGAPEILAETVLSQSAAHAPYAGVVPEIAARAHLAGGDVGSGGGLDNAADSWVWGSWGE